MNNLIILAGYPATGKTYVINQLKSDYEGIERISIDEIEETLYDKFGFDNSYEKKKLYNLSFEIFYLELEKKMKEHKDILIDYPFSYLQYGNLKELTTKYNYNNITIRLTGKIEDIYKRRVNRDLNSSRNAGHLLERYNKDMEVTEDIRKNNLISFNDFVNHCKLREYDNFRLGSLLVMDVTNDYADLKKIKEFLKIEMRE